MPQFAAEAGYWPWAALMLILTAIVVYALRAYYDRQEQQGS